MSTDQSTPTKDSRPMSEAPRALCGALDRLLTIGSYYQPSHERFQAVAQECVEALLEAAGTRDKVEVFITAQGLMIDKGHLGADEVEARRLFDLLDPLQIALLEIDTIATSDHLHLALASMKKAHSGLAGSRSYREIEVTGLPESVRAISRSLFLKTHAEEKPKPKPPPRSKEPEVSFFEHNMVSELLLADTAEAQRLEKEFVGIIQGIMATADPTKLKNSSDEETDPTEWLPEETLDAIEKVLESLAGTGSDLMNLQHLIAQAQTALEMTGDPQLVDLIFARLQKDSRKLARKRVQPKMIGKDQKGTRGDTRKKLIMSQEEMREIVDSLEVPLGPMVDPLEQAFADSLDIAVQLMDLAPAEELVSGIEETLLRMMTRPRLSSFLRSRIVQVCRALLTGSSTEVLDRTWPMIWGPLRRSHSQHLVEIWLDIWDSLNSKGRERAWAFLVNDLTLGMPRPDRIRALMLMERLGRVQALGNNDIRIRLENLPAIQQGELSEDLFWPPAPLLYPVYKVLIGSSLSRSLGPRLHDHLVEQAPHKLSSVLLEIMDGYQPINRAVYHAIFDQGVEEELHPGLVEIAPELLQEALADLHWDFMEESWVVPAISWLGKLGREQAMPVLRAITEEKKYMVLSSWPLTAREAAGEALQELQARLQYTGRPGASEQSADPSPRAGLRETVGTSQEVRP